MFRGKLALLLNINDLKYLDIRFNKVVVVTENKIPQILEQCPRGTILLPPYEASMFRCDNRHNEFYMAYRDHIYSKECLGFLCAMFKAMMQGINIYLYLTRDELDMYYNCFASILFHEFGITIETDRNPFIFNNNAIPKILSMLYDFDLLSIDDMMNLYPQGLRFSQSNIYKMINESQLQGDFETLENYFNDLKESKYRHDVDIFVRKEK